MLGKEALVAVDRGDGSKGRLLAVGRRSGFISEFKSPLFVHCIVLVLWCSSWIGELPKQDELFDNFGVVVVMSGEVVAAANVESDGASLDPPFVSIEACDGR